MSPPTPRLMAATLAELESTTGFAWFVTAPRNEITFPERFRGLLQDAAKELHALEPQLAHVSVGLQQRLFKHSAWVAEALGDFDKAALFQRRLGNTSEADSLKLQANIAREMRSLLAPGRMVTALRPLDRHQGIWAAVVVGNHRSPGVLIAQKTARGWKQLDALTTRDDAESVHLAVLGSDLIVLVDVMGGSWQPVEGTSYQLRKGKLHPTKEFFSEHGIRLRKLHGHWTLSTFHCIGFCPSHGEQPRWLEVFQQGKNGWRLASAQYPELFKDYPHQIRLLLKDYPRENVLPVYLHWTERLLRGKPVGSPPQKHALKIDA